MWYIYIVECPDKTLYTGITTDMEKRIKTHNCSNKGAKYTRGRRPVKVVYLSEIKNRSDSLKEEARIKKLSRKEKLKLIVSGSDPLVTSFF
ncbi:MAG: GIY-YIG nuclease family protein [Nitrospirota bacterium]